MRCTESLAVRKRKRMIVLQYCERIFPTYPALIQVDGFIVICMYVCMCWRIIKASLGCVFPSSKSRSHIETALFLFNQLVSTDLLDALRRYLVGGDDMSDI